MRCRGRGGGSVRLAAAGVVLLAVAGACGREPPRPMDGPELRPDEDAGHAAEVDRDHDALCDSTEEALGTDPDALDGDRDELPDLIELVTGREPTLPDDPPPEELAYLPGERGAGLDFEVRFTVDGDGQALTGSFASLAALYRDGDSAERYYAGSMAIEAAPADAARSVEREAARFEAVLGKTRLSFSLRFELGPEAARDCARAYPFRYTIKSDDGQPRADRDYLLVVGQGGAARLQADAFCLPTACD